MRSLRNIPSTLVKSTLLAAFIFWLMIFSSSDFEYPVIILFSLVPIFIVCALTITFTIVPFLILEDKGLSVENIFKKHFPYYAVLAFGIAFYCIIISDFDEFLSAFMLSAFFTLMQSWVWLCKPPINKTLNKI